jgi:hypothetical protein
MRKLCLIVFIVIVNINYIYSTEGELLLKIKDFEDTNWQVSVKKINGTVYFDENFDLLSNPHPDYYFNGSGDKLIIADFCWDQTGEGTIDEYGHIFVTYYGIL